MLRGASKPARGSGGIFDAGGDRPLSRRQRRKRQLVLDVFVFVFVGVWIGFAVHSQFTVGRLHEVSDSRKGVRTMVIQDNGPKQHGVNEETAVASRGEATASSPGKALSSAGWEWDQISGLFGGGGGLREPDRSETAPLITPETLTMSGSIHSHQVQVLSREPRIQLFRDFASADIVRTAILDLDAASANGGTLDAGDYDASNRFGLRALKTLVVNATYYPSVISSPWKVYRIGGEGVVDGGEGDDFFERYPFMDDIYDTRRNAKLVGDVKMTMLITLQAPEDGGETYFPLEGVTDEVGHDDFRKAIPRASRESLQRMYQDRNDCSNIHAGLTVKTAPGDAILMYRSYPNNFIDMKALFGLCRVKRGRQLIVAAVDATIYEDKRR